MKHTTTKSALLTSAMALLLCFAMLLGTTFAWFTDTASTGVNKIQAGNLDVKVEYSKDGTTWNDIQGTTSLFSDNLWEPGHTEYVYLRVKNAGSLALKYKVMVTPVSENGGINVNNANFKLSDYLVFGTTAPKTSDNFSTFADRAAARAAVTTATTTMGLNQTDLTKTGTMVGKNVEGYADQYLALVIYMPETVGNEANAKPGTTAPSIDLGITVVATQLENESDSFDEHYDAGAVTDTKYVAGAYYDYFEAVNVTATAAGNGTFTVKKTDSNDGIIASASGTAAAGAKVNMVITKTSTPANNFNITVNEGEELNGYDIKVTGQAAGSLVQGQLYVGTGLQGFVFYHNGRAMNLADNAATGFDKTNLADGNYYYDSNDGYVYFATTSFSPFQAKYTAPVAAINTAVYGTLADAVAAAKDGDTVILLKDATLASTLTVNKNITLNLNGNTITGNNSTNISMTTGVLTVKNGVIDVSGEAFRVNGKNNATEGSLVLNIENSVTVKSSNDCCVYIYGRATLNTAGKLYNSSKYTTIQTHGTLDTTVVNVTGGVVENATGTAIYFANGKELNISGGEITGTTAVSAKGGKVTISDGAVLHGKGEKFDPTEAENSGTNDTGDAFYIEDNYQPAVIANITGGTFISDNANAVNILFKQEQKGSVISITGGTFSTDPSAFVAEGYSALQDGNQFEVINGVYTSDEAAVKQALAAGNNVILADNMTVAATKGGYNFAGLVQSSVSTIDGNNKTLKITGANGTWDCGIYTNGGTIKNLTLTGAFRGIFTDGLTSDLLIENCTLKNVIYTFNADGSGDYNVTFKDTTLNGWTSYTSGFKSVSFYDCNFGWGSGYAYFRPYTATTLTNCVFETGFEMDTSYAPVSMVNCKVGDTLITQDNVAELLGNDAATQVSFL